MDFLGIFHKKSDCLPAFFLMSGRDILIMHLHMRANIRIINPNERRKNNAH